MGWIGDETAGELPARRSGRYHNPPRLSVSYEAIMTAPVHRLRAFGGLTLEQTGVDAPVGSIQGRRLALLAFLARGTPGVRREGLAAQFWPDSDADRARNALNQAVFALRRELGENAIIVAAGEVRLNIEVVTADVIVFERELASGNLEQAITLYTGPFLDGFFLPDADAFERWAESQRAQLARRYLDALGRLASGAESSGQWSRAAHMWQLAVAAEPLSARFVVRLMRALAAAGDRTAALQQARTYAELTRREFDADPDPAVLAAEADIRNGKVDGDTSAQPLLHAIEHVDAAHASLGTEVDRSSSPPPSSAPSGPDREAGPVTAAPSSPPRRHASRGVAVAAIGLAAALSFLAVRARREARAEHVRPVLASTRVLIAPFQNVTGDTTLDHLGTMAADAVGSAIARTGLIDVVDWRRLLTEITPDTLGGRERTRVVALARLDSAAGAARVAELARETGAGAIVWGQVGRSGDSVRFDTWIVRGDGRTLVHTLEPVSSPLESPVEAIERIKQNVAGAFAALADPRLAAWSGATAHTPPYDAYVQYIEGLEAMARRQTKTALTYFDRAIAADSDFVEAMLWLSDVLESTPNGRPRSDSLFKMLDARRDRLAPYDQAVLDTKVGWLSGDRDRMYRAAVRMTELAPGSNDAHWARGSTAVMTNRFSEAIQAFSRVDETRGWMKDWDYYLRWPSLAYHARGEYDRELELVRKHRARFPRSNDLCLLELRALAAMGHLSEIDQLSPTCNALPTAAQFQAPLTHHFIAKELRTHGWRDAARAHADSAVAGFRERSEREPNNVGLRQGMAFSYLEGGRWAEARALYEALDKTTPTSLPGILTSIGVAAARQSDVTTADSLLRRVSADTSMPPSWIALYKARIASSMGREEEALESLREAVRGGFAPVEVIHYDVGLERLHTTRGWKELMAERR